MMTSIDVIVAMAALAQETRLAIYRLLVETGPDGLAAGVIADKVGVAASSLSFHLAQLLHAGLVSQRRVSRSLIYAADYTTMNSLMGYLAENCCGGQACAPICQPERASSRPRKKSA
jgi:ArsR family transcriptional regulator, arsenate/arsenite/antimonite-responsive transcriptional repressor